MLPAKANPATSDRGVQKGTTSWWNVAENNRHARTSKAKPPGCRSTRRRVHLIPDAKYPGMWRVFWPDGQRSDMTNLTRAKDALASFLETEERRQRGRRSRAGRSYIAPIRRGAS